MILFRDLGMVLMWHIVFNNHDNIFYELYHYKDCVFPNFNNNKKRSNCSK